MKKTLILKEVWLVCRILLSIGILALDGFLLYRFDYLHNLTAIDNLLGVIPLAFLLLFTVSALLLLWIKHTKRTACISVILAGWVCLTSALFPVALKANWFFGKENTQAGSDGDISQYAPFAPDTLAVKLKEKSTLSLSENLPKMDGALALYPIYSAVAQTVYDESSYNGEVLFTNTIRGFNALIAGERDIFFSAYPSKAQLAAAEKAGVELCFTPIGREAFVFVVAKSNPVENLTYQQIRNVYSGKTSMWRTLGWAEGGEILKFQRPEGSGSQSGLQSIMKDLPIQSPQPLPSPEIIGTNSLMKQITVTWKGVQPALGYTYRFFGVTMNPNPDAKFLKIDGVAPSVENIRSDSYPFVADFYAITVGKPEGNTKKVVDWLLSEQGQTIIEQTGYSPIS